jgi:hypothetical protein
MTSCFWADNLVKLGGIAITPNNKSSIKKDVTVLDLYTGFDDFQWV